MIPLSVPGYIYLLTTSLQTFIHRGVTIQAGYWERDTCIPKHRYVVVYWKTIVRTFRDVHARGSAPADSPQLSCPGATVGTAAILLSLVEKTRGEKDTVAVATTSDS